MIKKILTGAALTGFIGLLVFGAVNRTIARSGNDTTASVGNGQGANSQEHAGNLESSRGSGIGEGEQTGRGGGQNNRQNGNETGVFAADEWLEFQATATSVESDKLTLATENRRRTNHRGHWTPLAIRPGAGLRPQGE